MENSLERPEGEDCQREEANVAEEVKAVDDVTIRLLLVDLNLKNGGRGQRRGGQHRCQQHTVQIFAHVEFYYWRTNYEITRYLSALDKSVSVADPRALPVTIFLN